EERSNGLWRGLPDQGGINVTAPDVREASHVAQDLLKSIRLFPGNGPGANPARADPANGASARLLDEVVLLAHLGEDLFQEEPRVLVAQGVVLEATVGFRFLSRVLRGKDAGVDENSDRDRDLSLVDEVVEDDGDSEIAVLLDIRLPVLKDHDARRL